jgi:hypothetical protein
MGAAMFPGEESIDDVTGAQLQAFQLGNGSRIKTCRRGG